MAYKSIVRRAVQLLVVASLLGFGFAIAQSEPSMDQIYAAARAGKLEEAQVMIQQVLVSHPKSAKAHFVRAELYSRQGELGLAREELATADKLGAGLPFAKPEAVQALRSQLAAGNMSKVVGGSTMNYSSTPASTSSSSWALPLLLAGGVIGLGYFAFRRRSPSLVSPQSVYANQGSGLSGPQTFGGGGAVMQAPPFGQPTGSGLGGRIMGGVATGLAVGAGVMAAEAIGKSLMGNHDQPISHSDSLTNHDMASPNTDMGGNDFGISDSASWDGGGAMDVGGGGDWDT